MENEYRHSPTSFLFEARHELRKELALETALIVRTHELPEEDFCHNARESLALGAGYAYMCLENGNIEDQGIHIFTAFFATQPRNRYLDEITIRRNQQALIKAALDQIDNTVPTPIDESIDPYKVEELAAFIDGYVMTRDYFAAHAHHSSIETAELA